MIRIVFFRWYCVLSVLLCDIVADCSSSISFITKGIASGDINI